MVAHFSHHLLTALPKPLLPFIRDEFALDYTRVGLVVSAFSLSYGISQLPAGWLSDRIGPRIVLTMGISGVAVFGLLVGVSQTFTMMLVFLVLMGIVAGGYHPTAPTLVPIVAAAMASVWGWRSPFIGLAIPTFAFGIVLYILLGRRAATDKTKYEPSSSPTETPHAPGYLRRLIPFIILSTFTVAIPFSVAPFIPLFMVDKFGVSREIAAAFLALIYSAGFWAAPLGGYLSDRLGRVKLLIVVGFVTSFVIYLLNLATYSLGIGALLICIGMLNYIRIPVSESYIISQTPERRRSTILGIYYFGGMEGIGIFTPVIGYLIDNFGFHNTFTIAGATIALVSLICSIFLWRIRD